MKKVVVPTVADMWASYQRDVVPAAAGFTQMTETRRAFYAGAFAMYKAITKDVADLPDDKAMAALALLHGELVGFGLDVARGVA